MTGWQKNWKPVAWRHHYAAGQIEDIFYAIPANIKEQVNKQSFLTITEIILGKGISTTLETMSFPHKFKERNIQN